MKVVFFNEKIKCPIHKFFPLFPFEVTFTSSNFPKLHLQVPKQWILAFFYTSITYPFGFGKNTLRLFCAPSMTMTYKFQHQLDVNLSIGRCVQREKYFPVSRKLEKNDLMPLFFNHVFSLDVIKILKVSLNYELIFSCY